MSMQKRVSKTVISFAITGILMAGAAATTVQAEEWQARAGAETPDRGSQALAFLPNEFWIHAGDSIRWTFPTHERHTLTFLQPSEVRPPAFGPVFGVPVGCPGGIGVTPDGSSFDGSSCVSARESCCCLKVRAREQLRQRIPSFSPLPATSRWSALFMQT